MEVSLESLRKSEQAAYRLRNVYEQYGYRKFRMAKFEEYDFYHANRDFLGSGQILTFTDLSGKLMALKPDVTMSIVKNTRATREQPEKFYYNENVYRSSREVREFKEIDQIGVEYIGEVTRYAHTEIVSLALKSLACLEDNYVLDISHMGIINGLLMEMTLPSGGKGNILRCIESKNPHELRGYVQEYALPEPIGACLIALASLTGGISASLQTLRPYIFNDTIQNAYDELLSIADVFAGSDYAETLNMDFSITAASKYYNGLMLRGYIQSVPRAILFGGQYDPLLQRMGKTELQAIGFALYFDEIERTRQSAAHAKYDAFVLYDNQSDALLTHNIVEALVARGLRVCACTKLPERTGGAKIYASSPETLAEVLA